MRLMTNHPCLLPLYRYGKETDETAIQTSGSSQILHSLDDASEFHQQVKDIIVGGGTCTICLDPIDQPTITNCKHIFCKLCIQQNYNIRKECPNCRQHIHTLTEIVPQTQQQHPTFVNIHIGNIQYQVDKQIQKLYQQAYHQNPKIDALMNIIQSSNDKIVVFTNTSKMLSHIELRLMESEVSYCIIRGNYSASKLWSMMESFQEDDKKRVFLLTLKSCAEGLTLTASSHVVFMEPCTSKRLFDQALGRIKRIGQTKPIQTTTIVMKHTIDEIIYNTSNQHQQDSSDHKTLFDVAL